MTKKSSVVPVPAPERAGSDLEIKFRGVRKRKWGKYVSEIRLPKSRERIWLGSYDSGDKAARAFDAAQFCLRGRSGNFNFPDSLPAIDVGMSMSPEEIQAAATRYAHAPGEMSASYSPSISEGSTVQVESEVSGVEDSFSEELRSTVQIESEVSGVEESFCDEFRSTVQMESEVSGVEESFYDELRLAPMDFGSGNFAAEFGFGVELLPEFDGFCSEVANFDIVEDFYDASIYQDSSLWSF